MRKTLTDLTTNNKAICHLAYQELRSALPFFHWEIKPATQTTPYVSIRCIVDEAQRKLAKRFHTANILRLKSKPIPHERHEILLQGYDRHHLQQFTDNSKMFQDEWALQITMSERSLNEIDLEIKPIKLELDNIKRDLSERDSVFFNAIDFDPFIKEMSFLQSRFYRLVGEIDVLGTEVRRQGSYLISDIKENLSHLRQNAKVFIEEFWVLNREILALQADQDELNHYVAEEQLSITEKRIAQLEKLEKSDVITEELVTLRRDFRILSAAIQKFLASDPVLPESQTYSDSEDESPPPYTLEDIPEYSYMIFQEAIRKNNLAQLEKYKHIFEKLDQPGYPTISKEIQSHLRVAVQLGRCAVVEYFIAQDIDLSKPITQFGKTALHMAAELGHADLVQTLLAHDLDIDYANVFNGWIALDYALDGGHVELLPLLIPEAFNWAESTLLHRAAKKNQPDVVEALLQAGAMLAAPDERGRTPLHCAVCASHIKLVSQLLEAGADPEAADYSGIRSLHEAAARGHINMAALLISKGAQVNAIDNNGYTPLLCAVDSGQPEMVSFLLSKEADIQATTYCKRTALHHAVENNDVVTTSILLATDIDVNLPDEKGRTVYAIAEAQQNREIQALLLHSEVLQNTFWQALAAGDVEKCKELIEKGVDCHAQDNTGNTALHKAVFSGKLALVQLLIARGIEDVPNREGKLAIECAKQHKDSSLFSCLYDYELPRAIEKQDTRLALKLLTLHSGTELDLHEAVQKADEAAVHALIRQGREVNATDHDGRTPLHRAALRGDTAIITILLNANADTEIHWDKDGSVPLHWAAAQNHLEAVDALIAGNAKIDARNHFDQTPFDIAIDNNCIKVVAYFLQKGCSPNGEAGREPPLCAAAKHGHIEVANLLIQYGANRDTSYDDGRTPLHLVASLAQTDFVSALLEVGVSPNCVDQHGNLPIHMAALLGNPDTLELLLKVTEDINKQDDQGRTALHIAVENGHFDAVRKLIEARADLTIKDQDGHTVLHTALIEQAHQISIYLHDNGANPFIADPYGVTPFHRMAALPDTHCLEKILASVASHDLTIADRTGRTALHWASEAGQVEAIALLVQHGADVKQKTVGGKTSLYCAVQQGSEASVSALLAAGAAANVNEPSDDQTTALHVAAVGGSEPVISLLLDAGADATQQDELGNTPLHLAAKRGHVNAVLRLAQVPDIDINMHNDDGDTPLHLAVVHENPGAAIQLVALGAELNTPNTREQTAIDLVASTAHRLLSDIMKTHSPEVSSVFSKEHPLPPITNLPVSALLLQPAVRQGDLYRINELCEHLISAVHQEQERIYSPSIIAGYLCEVIAMREMESLDVKTQHQVVKALHLYIALSVDQQIQTNQRMHDVTKRRLFRKIQHLRELHNQYHYLPINFELDCAKEALNLHKDNRRLMIQVLKGVHRFIVDKDVSVLSSLFKNQGKSWYFSVWLVRQLAYLITRENGMSLEEQVAVFSEFQSIIAHKTFRNGNWHIVYAVQEVLDHIIQHSTHPDIRLWALNREDKTGPGLGYFVKRMEESLKEGVGKQWYHYYALIQSLSQIVKEAEDSDSVSVALKQQAQRFLDRIQAATKSSKLSQLIVALQTPNMAMQAAEACTTPLSQSQESHASITVFASPPHQSLLVAVINDDFLMVQHYLQRGADIHTRDESGYTPVLLAATHGHFELLTWLLEFGGASQDDLTPEGLGLVALAKQHQQEDIVSWLQGRAPAGIIYPIMPAS